MLLAGPHASFSESAHRRRAVPGRGEHPSTPANHRRTRVSERAPAHVDGCRPGGRRGGPRARSPCGPARVRADMPVDVPEPRRGGLYGGGHGGRGHSTKAGALGETGALRVRDAVRTGRRRGWVAVPREGIVAGQQRFWSLSATEATEVSITVTHSCAHECSPMSNLQSLQSLCCPVPCWAVLPRAVLRRAVLCCAGSSSSRNVSSAPYGACPPRAARFTVRAAPGDGTARRRPSAGVRGRCSRRRRASPCR